MLSLLYINKCNVTVIIIIIIIIIIIATNG